MLEVAWTCNMPLQHSRIVLTWNLCIIAFHSKLIANRLNLLILITSNKWMVLLYSIQLLNEKKTVSFFFLKKKRMTTLIYM